MIGRLVWWVTAVMRPLDPACGMGTAGQGATYDKAESGSFEGGAVLTIVTQGVLSIVFGFLGLVAVPLLAAATVPIKMLYVPDVVGDEVKLATEEGAE
jgi:hypothetical protein